jgi:heme-degrading monooxygenase HmoA
MEDNIGAESSGHSYALPPQHPELRRLDLVVGNRRGAGRTVGAPFGAEMDVERTELLRWLKGGYFLVSGSRASADPDLDNWGVTPTRSGREHHRSAPVQGQGVGLSGENRTERGVGSLPEATDGPVTTTVTRRVKPGHEPFYEQFLEGVIAAATRFPGHLGVEVFRPQNASTGEYRVVYRFDRGEHLRAWLDSDERGAWLERAEPHVIGPMRTQLRGARRIAVAVTTPGRRGQCGTSGLTRQAGRS